MQELARYPSGNTLYIQYLRYNSGTDGDSVQAYILDTDSWHNIEDLDIDQWNETL